MAIYQSELITFKLNCSFQLQGELQNHDQIEWLTKLNRAHRFGKLPFNLVICHLIYDEPFSLVGHSI